MNKIIRFFIICTSFILIVLMTSCNKNNKEKLVIANWAEYIDPEVITDFEAETGIDIIYEEFDTNESLYPKLEASSANYDLVCPSDYMIQKMIENNLLQKINYSNIPNYKNIDEQFIEKSKGFDKNNEYSIPYCWGTVGILYNKTMVKEKVDSWNILWDEKYHNDILMQASIRDSLMVALAKNGCSINTKNKDELIKAKNDLIKQKPIVQAYVIDQVRDKMIGEEAALGVIYSGEAIYTKRANKNLEYVIPKEGSNIWIDSWVIPKSARNVSAAEKFLNYLCAAEIAYKNFEYITYSTPNKAAYALVDDPYLKNNEVVFPKKEDINRCETYQYLGQKYENLYAKYWNEVQAS